MSLLPKTTCEGNGIRSRLGLEKGACVCLSVADFTNPGKRFFLLLQIGTALHERYPRFRLLIVGTVPDSSDPLPEWCVAPGYSSTPQDYYAAADLYLCISRHEGLGTAILDAVVRDPPCSLGKCRRFHPEEWDIGKNRFTGMLE